MLGYLSYHLWRKSMKKWFLSLLTIFICSISFSAQKTPHTHPGLSKDSKPALIQSIPTCLIKITNDSHYDIIVSGQFDDGAYLQPFVIQPYEMPHYISLYYFNICHGVMDVQIETNYGLKLYDQPTYVNSKILIKSGWLNPYTILEKKSPEMKK